MSHLPNWLSLLAVMSLACARPVNAQPSKATDDSPFQKESVQTDRYGDPLPPGAIARFGTVRLRQRGEVWSVIFTPDGQTVIAGGPLPVASEEVNTVRFWDVRTGKLVRSLGQPFGSGHLALSADGKILASESGTSTVWIWDLSLIKPIHQLEPDGLDEGNIISVAFSPDGKTMAAIGVRSKIQLWDVQSGELRHRFGDKNGGWRVLYSPDGKSLAWSGSDSVGLWDLATEKKVWEIPSTGNGFHSLAFSPDGKLLAAGEQAGTIRLIEVGSGKELRRCQGLRGDVQAVAFSPDGKSLASGGDDQIVRIWDAATGKEVHTCRGHQNIVYGVAFSPDGKTLASGSRDQTVRLWDVATGEDRFPFVGHQDFVCSVAFSPDGKTLASGGFCDEPRLWNLATAREIRILPKRVGAQKVTFSPDGKILAIASWEPAIRLYDAAGGMELRQLRGHRGRVYNVVFSPDGRLLASASNDGTIRLWEIGMGKEISALGRWCY